MTKNYIIIFKKQEVEDAYIFRLKPENGKIVYFIAGQYITLQNPKFKDPNEKHPFSIASCPSDNFIELCIKVYGDWTKKMAEVKIGDELFVTGPYGKFTWDTSITDAVFVLGGIGISPIMSMLRCIRKTNHRPTLTMLYGNRTPETIAYDDKIKEFEKTLGLKRVDIFSHLSKSHPWQGYRGFITGDILEKEVALTKHPTFFVIGPPIFIEKMQKILKTLGVQATNIRTESLEEV